MKSSGTFFSIISVREWPVCRSHQGENKTSFYLVPLKNFVWEKFVRFGPFLFCKKANQSLPRTAWNQDNCGIWALLARNLVVFRRMFRNLMLLLNHSSNVFLEMNSCYVNCLYDECCKKCTDSHHFRRKHVWSWLWVSESPIMETLTLKQHVDKINSGYGGAKLFWWYKVS